ncbi:hypothetical protein V1511DRAFT_503547 [Dipodascopsis uninucleata]
MASYQLSGLIDHLSNNVNELEQSKYDAEIDSDVNEVAYRLFHDIVKRNILTTDLDYAKKLLAKIDNTPVSSTLASDSQRQTQEQVLLHIERKRISDIQDRLKLLVETHSTIEGAVRARIAQINAIEQSDALLESDIKDDVVSIGSDIDMLSTPPQQETDLFSFPSDSRTTLESRLDYHRKQQDAISQSLLSQTRILKENAVRLGEKLTGDMDLVRNTANALDQNVDNMKRTGGRLTQYRQLSAIGFKFYIVSALIMIFSVFIGVIVIKVLPKW